MYHGLSTEPGPRRNDAWRALRNASSNNHQDDQQKEVYGIAYTVRANGAQQRCGEKDEREFEQRSASKKAAACQKNSAGQMKVVAVRQR